jgi:hypothetical protein
MPGPAEATARAFPPRQLRSHALSSRVNRILHALPPSPSPRREALLLTPFCRIAPCRRPADPLLAFPPSRDTHTHTHSTPTHYSHSIPPPSPQSFSSAAAALDAIDGRTFDSRPLRAEFDDGSLGPRLPASPDAARQERFGFGEAAGAYIDSIRMLQLAAAEGAPVSEWQGVIARLEWQGVNGRAGTGGGACVY